MTDRILLVEMADIGDLIVTTPAIAALREARPEAHLTLLTTAHSAPVIEQGLVDEILTLKRKSGQFNQSMGLLNPTNWGILRQIQQNHYDVVVYFHHFTLRLGTFKFWLIKQLSGAKQAIGIDNGKGWFLTDKLPDDGYGAKHQAQYWLDLVALLGAEPRPYRARVAFDDGILPIAAHMGKRIIIHAGSGGYSTARRWEAEKFAKVADALHEKYEAQIVLVGTADDNADQVTSLMRHRPINLTGKTTLTQLADVIRSADLYIGADSGVMHLAAAVSTPTIAIFGPSNHEAWSPWSPRGKTVVIRSAPQCSPCSYVGHGIGLREGCEARTCMKMVNAEEVIIAARSILDDMPMPEYRLPVREQGWYHRIQILGLPVDNINYEEWMGLINRWVRQGTRVHHVCTVNPEFMILAQHDVNFANILRRADLCVPDGIGILWAADILKNRLKERVTGSDGIYRIAQEAAERGWRLFFLGAAEGIAAEAAQILTEKYEGLQIVGTYSGSPSPEEEADIVERVNMSGADVLLVAYGAPRQDKWIARNTPRLAVKMAMGVGGAFDFVVGRVPRAPEWMQDWGLEWLYRLYKEPRRIWRMTRLPRFVVSVIIRGSK